ncbi:putative flippase GtrA [Saccharopolyspora gloriosae]|uniref:Putative flippase GtrA n=1 Tax=Saccharopolyspora gloriosae TaxID=455344 RepID=A0A840NH47_9PSEU|nr:putative flippase GtrA [Saccharopolyspora gloriosae]
MSVVEAVLARVPRPLRDRAVRHRELVKFAIVGASTFFIDSAIFYALKLTILVPKPVTAKVIAVLVATIVSYVLNREWSFRTRGGRERHHEAALYFLFSGIGVALYAAPLWFSRYALHLQTPYTSRFVEEIADFTAAQVVGLILGMVFRWWAFRRWVFPADEDPDDVNPTGGDRTGSGGAEGSANTDAGDAAPAAESDRKAQRGLDSIFHGTPSTSSALATGKKISNSAGRALLNSNRPPSASTSARANARPTPVEPPAEKPRSNT